MWGSYTSLTCQLSELCIWNQSGFSQSLKGGYTMSVSTIPLQNLWKKTHTHHIKQWPTPACQNYTVCKQLSIKGKYTWFILKSRSVKSDYGSKRTHHVRLNYWGLSNNSMGYRFVPETLRSTLPKSVSSTESTSPGSSSQSQTKIQHLAWIALVLPSMMTEMELERSALSTREPALLEEIRERMSVPKSTGERMPALWRHWVIRVLACIEPCAELWRG